jgi:predicted DNA-binding mobile mystery protein A
MLLRCQKLDRDFRRLRAAWGFFPHRPPPEGWVRHLRDALGMNTRQLAARLGTSRQAVLGLEARERRGAITLDTLARAAEALECELRYVLIPRGSLHRRRYAAMVGRLAQRLRAHHLWDEVPPSAPDAAGAGDRRPV